MFRKPQFESHNTNSLFYSEASFCHDTKGISNWNINELTHPLNNNLMHKLSFIHIILQFLYMFRAINAHLQEVTFYKCSLW
jgi:hypothetical protein